MAIVVVCTGCKKRFQVDEKFAGRKGPCPSCKQVITIPQANEQVVVHAPEHDGPADATGQPILKPIERTEDKTPPLIWGAIIGGIVTVFLVCLMLRFSVEDKSEFPTWILAIGALMVAPPLSVGAYSVLKEEEVEAFAGLELWGRAAICGAVYAIFWALYGYIPGLLGIEEMQIYEYAIFIPVLVAAGAVAPLAAFDLEYPASLMHFGFYILVSVILALVIGIPII